MLRWRQPFGAAAPGRGLTTDSSPAHHGSRRAGRVVWEVTGRHYCPRPVGWADHATRGGAMRRRLLYPLLVLGLLASTAGAAPVTGALSATSESAPAAVLPQRVTLRYGGMQVGGFL